jgi:ubiquinone/menaquinone biosynthesis C-methylase UbiE
MSNAGSDRCPSAAFDAMARSYDASFTHTSVGKVLREIVWSRADQVFNAPGHLLELGCGTGEDAIRFGNSGFKVTATDASSHMIDVAHAKARKAIAPDNLEFSCVPMERVATVFQGRQFDGVFSNFGAVNCVADLRALSVNVAAVLAPGAPLLWVVMGRHVPWEWFWYLARGKPGKALRRLRSAGAQWRGLTICYPTPAAITAALAPDFVVTRISPLGCVLPPSYAADWLDRSPRMLAALSRMERAALGSQLLANWSDHYIVEARRSSL